MEYLFEAGFLGTRAPCYMDGIVIYLLFLPFFIALSIFLAIKEKHELHRSTQRIFFTLTVIVLLSFNYGIYMYENFDKLMATSSIGYTHAYYAFMFQVGVSITMVTMWLSTLLFALEDRRRRALPGLYSKSHKRSGKRVFVAILFSVVSIEYVYWILYIA